jgi:hypothetical protein
MSNGESLSQIRSRLLRAKLDEVNQRIERTQLLCEILYGQLDRQRAELQTAYAYLAEEEEAERQRVAGAVPSGNLPRTTEYPAAAPDQDH